MSQTKIRVLLVEDNPTDALIMREGLVSAEMHSTLDTVSDGVEAMDFLHRRGEHVNAHRPDLVLLDLNMPRKGGREVLTEMKADDSLKNIPVVVLTTSKSSEDVSKAYGLHANCYISKPVDFDEFTRAMRTIRKFWFSVATLPKEEK
jgi:two-component system, chemotaxis family, response regulator Rcp1